MTSTEFKEAMRRLDIIRKGNGPTIAEKAGISYNTYCNALKGFNCNPDVLSAIVAATEKVLEELKLNNQITVI